MKKKKTFRGCLYMPSFIFPIFFKKPILYVRMRCCNTSSENYIHMNKI